MANEGRVVQFERLKYDTASQRDSFMRLYRAAVPGGWLVVMHQDDGSGLTFVPDPEHRWDGGSVDVKRGGE